MERRKDEWRWWPLSSIVLITICLQLSSAEQEVAASSGKLFKRFTLDPNSNRIYLGAVNEIVILNGDTLQKLVNTTTGPREDSDTCVIFGDRRSDSCSDLSTTDNHNKVLLVDTVNNRLLTCGSVFQGLCEVRSLDDGDIAEKYTFNEKYILAAPTSDDEYRSIAFIAPGPVCDEEFGDYLSSTDTLYTALSLFYPDGRQNDEHTFIASHKLTNRLFDYLEFTYADFSGTTKTSTYFMDIEETRTRIFARAGFAHDGFSYFAFLAQYDAERNTHSSKLAQICQRDCHYFSYVDIPLTCEGYPLVETLQLVRPGSNLASDLRISSSASVIIGLFRSGDRVSQYGPDSAVCVYTVGEVREAFTANIQSCANGDNNNNNNDIFATSFQKTCTQASGAITDDFCDDNPANSPLSGTQALSKRPLITLQNTVVTSLAVDVVDRYTVAFIGTMTGNLKKVELRENKEAYESQTIEAGQPILGSMALVDGGSNVLVLTEQKLYKKPTSDCGRASSCSDCRALNDPYCGWCSLEAKCSVREECRNQQLDKRWISYEGWCVSISEIDPNQISLERGIDNEYDPQILTVTMTDVLPTMVNSDQKYKCVFGTVETIGTVESSPNKVMCSTPLTKPALPVAVDHSTVVFSLKAEETGQNFVQSEFTFYECGFHDRCSTCADARWNCQWCAYENRCRDSFSTCMEDTSIRSSSQCPRITHDSVNNEILVPAGTQYEIRIDAQNLIVPLDNQNRYECVVHNQDPPTVVRASTQSNQVICQAHSYTYTRAVGFEEPTVSVRWGNGFIVEDRDALNIILFKCDVLGNDCSECLSLNENSNTDKFNCGFCGNTCTYRNDCSVPVVLECPPAEISNITPLTSTLGGGTEITISGEDLGQNFGQVENAVTFQRVSDFSTVARCDAIESKYLVSRRIVCKVTDVRVRTEAYIKININNEIQQYPEVFTFKDPEITGVTPSYGPASGGTALTIEGRDLMAGNVADIMVTIGDNTPCNREEITDTTIHCSTGNHSFPSSPQNVFVKYMSADGNAVNDQVVYRRGFEYKLNPSVTEIAPEATFLSGGRIITVSGQNLDVVQTPLMYIEMSDVGRRDSLCEIISSNELHCSAPCLKDVCDFDNEDGEENENEADNSRRKRRDSHTLGPIRFGFVFDGVRNYWANGSLTEGLIEVYADPEFYRFENGEKKYVVDSASSLEIEGNNIDHATTPDEILVMVGLEQCSVRTISPDRLYCTPPRVSENSASKTKFPVTVTVGNIQTEIGELIYEFKPDSFDELLIILVSIAGAVLLAIILVLIVVYKRKKTQADRQYKKLKMQLDTLESNVRNECKQAFAELQTEVSDFTSDISEIGIPYWDYKTYTFKVLFPSHGDHPVLHSSPDYKTNKYGSYDQGLHQFSQLLNSKQFMLIFIRTLEQQKNFSIRDKAVVASLLMIVLQDKMEYSTEILKALLTELIDKSVEKKHPKLMLRRTESVVEKLLTNWLSIAMYGYLKKHSGQPLFMLYQAIKRQTEKGPVDGISSEARYSLSEDRLLREKIEPKPLTIHLVQDGQREPTTCKVLDIDTITQAKHKALDAVYLNMPFSNRPSVHDVDLEWRTGKSGHLPLQDEDVTTEVISGWKRVNTLAHYHVPDGAVMALVAKRQKTEGVRQVHGRIEITTGTKTSGIRPIVTMEEGQKVWHLVKHDDGIYISRNQKVISEIFLTRLLATKGTLQQYIDDLFMTILRVDSQIPPAVKWLFDLLDQAAKRHNIVDPDVVHTWKSNSLPLRFWVNIIKNPDFVFDINKSHIADSCLSVIAQTFMDACSTTDHKLGKDSPSNKLLFAKDIPRYRNWVCKYYKGIQEMAPVSDTDINEIMTEMSLHYTADFNVSIALKELYKYAYQYNFELLENLDEDPSAKKLHLANMFEQVTAALDQGTLLR